MQTSNLTRRVWMIALDCYGTTLSEGIIYLALAAPSSHPLAVSRHFHHLPNLSIAYRRD
jgi:hypothetical protein